MIRHHCSGFSENWKNELPATLLKYRENFITRPAPHTGRKLEKHNNNNDNG